MKRKIELFIMLWKVLNGSKEGCIFFWINDEQQQRIIRKDDFEIRVKYVGVDKRAVEELVLRMSKSN